MFILRYNAKSSSQGGCDPLQTGFKIENQTKLSMQKYAQLKMTSGNIQITV